MTETATLPVSYAVLGIQRLSSGKLVGLANAEIDIAGVTLRLQGIQIISSPQGYEVRSPQFRCGAGVWRSAVVVPDALRDALGAEVLLAFRASAT